MTLEGVANGTVIGGVIAIVLFFLREFRKIKLENRKTEQTVPLEVRTSAAVTFEAEQAAARKSFDQDRALKDNTIRDLTHRNEELVTERDEEHNLYLTERGKRRAAESEIEALKEKIREMQRQIQDLMDTVEIMSERITLENENEDALHPGPGS